MSDSIKHQHLVKSFWDTRLPIQTAGHFTAVTTVLYQAWNHLEAPQLCLWCQHAESRCGKDLTGPLHVVKRSITISFLCLEEAGTRVRHGDAKGHHGADRISLKCHLKQTSSDKVMPFLCPSPLLKITLCCGAKADVKTARLCEAGMIMKTANRSWGKRNELEAAIWACRSCRKCVQQILTQQVLNRSAFCVSWNTYRSQLKNKCLA